jgi:protein gp37
LAEKTGISWTHHTFNPWWGCNEVSAGCDHCYARTLSERWGHMVWGPPATTARRFFGHKHWAEPIKWNTKAKADGVRRRVFCASMADVFEFDPHHHLDEQREALYDLIHQTKYLDWLLLTKRPEQIEKMLPELWLIDPPENVWLGTSVEDQAAADLRIPRLLQVPAAVHWLSCEPLLGPVDLMPWLWRDRIIGDQTVVRLTHAIDWVIVGGESGANYRPMNIDWARSIRDQCQQEGAGFWYKQGASRQPGQDATLDGVEWHQLPYQADAGLLMNTL